MLRIIDNAVHRGAEIVNNIREYLRGSSEIRTRVNMRRLLEEVLQLAQPILEMHSDVKVTHQIDEACEVYASPAELRRVFTNLVLNALDAMPQGGALTILCTRSEGRMMVSVGRYRTRNFPRSPEENLLALLHHQSERHRTGPIRGPQGHRGTGRRYTL